MRYVLADLAEDVSVLEAATASEAMEILSREPEVDLALIDLHMPQVDGFSLLDSCRAQCPTLPLVVLSASASPVDVQRAMDAGAMGYVLKDTASKVMLSALQVVLSGGVYVPRLVASAVDLQEAPSFTPRQLQVLSMIVEGAPNKLIASRMEIAEATIKMHVTAIFKKLGVDNRTQAALAATKMGLDLPSVPPQ